MREHFLSKVSATVVFYSQFSVELILVIFFFGPLAHLRPHFSFAFLIFFGLWQSHLIPHFSFFWPLAVTFEAGPRILEWLRYGGVEITYVS